MERFTKKKSSKTKKKLETFYKGMRRKKTKKKTEELNECSLFEFGFSFEV